MCPLGKLKKSGIFLFLIAILSCQTSENQLVFHSNKTVQEIKQMIPPLKQNCPDHYPPALQRYFSYYNLNYPQAKHCFGYIVTGKRRIASHIFIPPNPKATIYLLHGYLLHVGNFHKVIKEFLSHNYCVAAFDLPGHGLSQGKNADIADFSEYAQTLETFLSITQNYLPAPYITVAHSTGAATLIEYLKDRKSPFCLHILVAPLVRSQQWALSKLGVTGLGWAIQTVPTLPGDVSSDKEHLEFLQHKDPLRSKTLPLHWVTSLFSWEKRITSDLKKLKGPFIIIQGDKDFAVDWKYNLPFLQQRIENLKIYYIQGGKHELLQEITEIRQKVYKLIMENIQTSIKDCH